MPKIIQELREKILAVSRTRLLTEGYAALSLRGIARDCSIAVGTIYNYFKDKNTLIASVMLEDWLEALGAMDLACAQAETAAEGYVGIYTAIRDFSHTYREVWAQFSQAGGSSGEIDSRHLMLRNQLTERIVPLLARSGRGEMGDIAPILAETVLAAAVQPDIGLEQITAFIQHVIPEK